MNTSQHTIRHIVMFDFSNLTAEIIEKLISEFHRLTDVPEVLAFEWGTENNIEDSPQGFTHCFLLTFADFDARTRYYNSKEHRDYENLVKQHRNKVLVFDYEFNTEL
jgi:hypothetical protein